MRSTSLIALAAIVAPAAASANDDPWALLGGIQIDEIITDTTYEVKKTYPAAIRDGAQEFRITGYAVPMYPGQATRDVLLVADMGDCPFCGSSDHGGSLQVELDEPVLIEEGQRISVIGSLELVDDPETWQAAILRAAKLVKS
ncbi:hypothetical protein [Maritimibacter sp. UBA3975]|uniref:hypothetical protein n=1 Tax=Maritimibacter sp. UBA3975 TaxID=1946833 RepID=UPI000C09D37D|nr:hypothetical protein [Maritimibacter sp. UBA3975]MAM61734.1 hypothetical protein [Maritimibacter sp.]